MRTMLIVGAVLLLLSPSVFAGPPQAAGAAPAWKINATAIEACSCPAFCQCYFNTSPAGHHSHEGGTEHFCRFNNAYKINRGNYGGVRLDGAKFWMSGDLGGDFSKGMMDWVVVTFDRALTKEQRDAISAVAASLFPVKWNSLTTSEGDIVWSGGKDEATATIDGGKVAEVRLKRFQGMTDDPVVLKNVKYWGASRNEGFIIMPNLIDAYRVGEKAFEYKGTNGFMLTFDAESKPAAKGAAASGR